MLLRASSSFHLGWCHTTGSNKLCRGEAPVPLQEFREFVLVAPSCGIIAQCTSLADGSLSNWKHSQATVWGRHLTKWGRFEKGLLNLVFWCGRTWVASFRALTSTPSRWDGTQTPSRVSSPNLNGQPHLLFLWHQISAALFQNPRGGETVDWLNQYYCPWIWN